jgi:AcrR family transcriptional regulator
MAQSHVVQDQLEAPERVRRADAQRNYDALIDVATAAFAEGGDVPLEELARRAGVGIGTLYRHFPTRDDLVLAVYRRDVHQLIAAADELAESRSAYDALAGWMARFVDHAATKRGMSSALKAISESSPDVFAGVRAQVLDALGRLVQAAVAEGSIRSDASAEDLLAALGGICLANTRQDWREQAERLLRLVLDGLRFGAHSR